VVAGNGRVTEHAGGYSDWLARGGRLEELSHAPGAEPTTGATAPAKPAPATDSAGKKRKLSYKDQRELDALPGLIETLEQRQQALEETVAGGDFYQQDHGRVQQVLDELAGVQQELETAFERWTELEGG
jgi:ABC transport system ATP-binding/permease protein